jgi:ubiquinone/menaquinone biosynthesis C-methylase UbiE
MLEEDHEKSRAGWDEMAAAWERNRDFMWATTRHVGAWLVDGVDAREGDTILDLAGGPGETGFLLAEAVGRSGTVLETDFAAEMVDVAHRRASELGVTNVETRVLDAQEMDLDDDSVDGIVCRWGFMLMIDPASALRECRRVLKEGRRLAFSVWSAPEKNPWVTVTGMTMIQLGHQPGRDPFGPGGIFSMSDHDTIRSMLGEAGFIDVTIEEMPVDWRYGSFDEAWDFMSQVAGVLAAAIKELSPQQVGELRSALEANFQAFRTDTGITLPGVAINVSAA